MDTHSLEFGIGGGEREVQYVLLAFGNCTRPWCLLQVHS